MIARELYIQDYVRAVRASCNEMQRNAVILLHTISVRMKEPLRFFLFLVGPTSFTLPRLSCARYIIRWDHASNTFLFSKDRRFANRNLTKSPIPITATHTIVYIQPHGPNLLLNRIQEQPQFSRSLCGPEDDDRLAYI